MNVKNKITADLRREVCILLGAAAFTVLMTSLYCFQPFPGTPAAFAETPEGKSVEGPAPATNTPAPNTRTRRPDPGGFVPSPQYLDRYCHAQLNSRIYMPRPAQGVARFDTVKALQEDRENRLRALNSILGTPAGAQQETVYNPAKPTATPEEPSPLRDLIGTPTAPSFQKESKY